MGRRVRKEFGGDLYDGSVVDFKPSKGWYLVRYDDGDSEDLFWKDLEQILVPSPASETDPAAAGGGGAPARLPPPLSNAISGWQFGQPS